MSRWQYPTLVEPISMLPEDTGKIDKWKPTYPSSLLPKVTLLAAIAAGSFFFCSGTGLEAITLDRWQSNYPSKFERKDFQVSDQQSFVSPLKELTSIDKWQPTYQSILDRKQRSLWQGEFKFDPLNQVTVVETLTIDKWIPNYPSSLLRPKQSFWQGESKIDPLQLTLHELISVNKWEPRYPNRLDRKISLLNTEQQSFVFPEIYPVPENPILRQRRGTRNFGISMRSSWR